MRLAPFQLPPNSYRLLAGLRYLFLRHEWEVPTPADILYFFCLKASPDQRGRGDGFYYLTCFPNSAAVIELPSHPNDFKDQFFMSMGFRNSEHHYFYRPRKFFLSAACKVATTLLLSMCIDLNTIAQPFLRGQPNR